MKDKTKLKFAVEAVLFAIGATVLYIGLTFFLALNEPLISCYPLLTSAFTALWLAIVTAAMLSAVKGKKLSSKSSKISAAVALAAATATFVVLILFTVGIEMFQPLTLSTETVVLLIVGVLFLLLSALASLIAKSNNFSALTTPALLTALMLVGVIWAECQPYAEYRNLAEEPNYIFSNGEGGYYTFRIPSLSALDKTVLNDRYSLSLEHDMLLALAEARESSRDVGDIDLVGKYSVDDGNTWSELFVVYSVENEKGKCGNPTLVFDKVNGVINLVFQYATAASGYDYRTYNLQGTVSSDLSFCWGEPILMNDNLSDSVTLGAADGVNENTIMAGPGKGLQLPSGRLLVPCSNKGEAFAMLSDDFGLTWRRGQSAGAGNECEAALLQSGEVVMTVRDNTECYLFHGEQYIRFAHSDDCGETWHLKASESTLKTPICMTSLATDADGRVLYCTYPDSFTARADLSVGVSPDGGRTWESKLLYDGAAGYSCAAVTSENKLFVLAEVGKVNYNEALVLLVPKV